MYSPVHEGVTPIIHALENSLSAHHIKVETLEANIAFLEQNGQNIKDLEEQKQALTEAKQTLEAKIVSIEEEIAITATTRTALENKLSIDNQTSSSLEQLSDAKKAAKTTLEEQKKVQEDLIAQKDLEIKKHQQDIDLKKKAVETKAEEVAKLQQEIAELESKKVAAVKILRDIPLEISQKQRQLSELDKAEPIKTSNTNLVLLGNKKTELDQKIQAMADVIDQKIPGLIQKQTLEIETRKIQITAKQQENENKYTFAKNLQDSLKHRAEQLQAKYDDRSNKVKEGQKHDDERKALVPKILDAQKQLESAEERANALIAKAKDVNSEFYHTETKYSYRVKDDQYFGPFLLEKRFINYYEEYQTPNTKESGGPIFEEVFQKAKQEYDRCQDILSNLVAQHNTLKTKVENLVTQISGFSTEISRIESSFSASKTELSKAAEEYKTLATQNNNLISALTQQDYQSQAEIEELQKILGEMRSKKAAATQQSAELKQQIDLKKAEITNLQKLHDASKAEVDKLKQEIKLAEDQKTTATTDLVKLANNIKTQTEAQTALKSQKTAAETEMKVLQDQLQQANLAKTSSTTEKSFIEAKIQTIETALTEMTKLSDSLILLEEKQATLQNLKTELTAVETSLSAKTSEYETLSSQIEGLSTTTVELKMQEFLDQKLVSESQIQELGAQVDSILSLQGQSHQEQVNIIGEVLGEDGENNFDSYL